METTESVGSGATKLRDALTARPRAALARFAPPMARNKLRKATKRRLERAQRRGRRVTVGSLRETLRRGWLATTEQDLHGLAPVHAAAMCGRKAPEALDAILSAVESLPKRDRDLDMRDKSGLSPLAHAVMANWGEGVRKLVGAGADVHAPFCSQLLEEWKRVPGEYASLLSFAVFLNAIDAFHALVECGASPARWDRSGMRAVHVAVLCGNMEAVRDLVARDGALGELDRAKAVELYTVREKYMKPTDLQIGQGDDVDDDDDVHDAHDEPVGDDAALALQMNGDEIDDNSENETDGPPLGFDNNSNPNSSRDFYRSLTADLGDFEFEDHIGRFTELEESDAGNVTPDDDLGETAMEDEEDVGASEDESLPDLIDDADEEMMDVAESEETNAQDAAIADALLGVLGGALKHALARAEKRRKAGAQSAGTARSQPNSTTGAQESADGDATNDVSASGGESTAAPPQEARSTIVRGAGGEETRIMQMGDMVTVQHMPGSGGGGTDEAEDESEGTRMYMNVLRAVYLALHAYEKEFYGATLLHLAARQKHHDAMRFLLESAPFAQSVSDRQNDGLTALHVAAEVDDPIAIDLLLAAGADINARSDTESTSALMLASKRGLKTTVKKLLEKGARVADEDDEGMTAIHYATASENGADVVAMLVEAGANVNAQTVEGSTPVYAAVAHGHSKVFQKLLDLGGDPSISNHDGSVPLGFIATKGMKELAAFAQFVASSPAIKEKMDMDITIGDQGQTALHMAATAGCPIAVKALIDAGADVNKLNEFGNSALMMVARAEEVESDARLQCLKHLLDAGANAKVAGEEGKQAIHFVTFLGEPECVELLLKHGADASAVTAQKTPLHLVALENNAEIAEILLKYNAKLNALDSIAMSPLMYAALKHSVDVLRVLIKAGANLTQKADGGMTALHIAAVTSDPRAEETVRLLCEAGAPMDVKDERGMCPIHLHADFERTRCVRRLLMCGCDPDLRCDSGFTPLIRACNSRNSIGDNMTLVRVLLRAGADVNAKNDNDNTVMSYLGDTEEHALIRVMLAAGADINVRDKQGDTPLHEAAMGDHSKTVALLVRRGADVNARNDDLQTPLFIAAFRGFADVVRALLARGVQADISIGNKHGLSPYHAAREAGHDGIASMLLDATGVRLSQFAPLTTFNVRSPRASFDDTSLRRHDSGRLLCVTCQETLRFGEEIRELPCGHAFHDPCILPWVGGEKMTNNRTCPVCKQLVAPADLFPAPM